MHPERFRDAVLTFGGMHLPVSLVGSLDALMKDHGLADVMGNVFAGLLKLLSGMKFPQNVRALSMVAEKLLIGVFDLS